MRLVKQIFYYVYLQWLTLYYTILRKLTPQPPVVLDPVDEYIKPRKRKLLATYETSLNLNANINPLLYDNDARKRLLRDESNETEKLWKARILYEPTPRGNIVMYYDMYRHGFAYYSDQNSIPYSVLNAVAMKYVVTFFCRDFFTDEETISLERLPKSFEEVEEKDDKNKENKQKQGNEQFAKFKQYRSSSENVISDTKKEVIKTTQKNKFISLGKLYNFQIVQKRTHAAKLQDQPTSYSDMFGNNLSYKAFKNKDISIK
jgi:hypothetical protein